MPSALERARAQFDAVHAEDPAGEAVRYHATLARWVELLVDTPSEALRLAACAQHLGRWKNPRNAYPGGVAGYKKWRATVALRHAEDAARVLEAIGYDTNTRERVAELITKKRLGRDPEVDAFEDAICLTFLELEGDAFVRKTEREKAVDVVRKTWAKMTERGHTEAAKMIPRMTPELRAVVESAIATPPPEPG